MAVSYKLADGNYIGASPLTNADTTAQLALGSIAKAVDTSTNAYGEAEFIYVKFTGTVAAGDLVVWDRLNKTCVQSATSATKGNFGISMAAQVTGQFGWVMIRGVHDAANVLSGATVGYAPNYGSALTAGRVTSAVTANYIIDGLAIRVTGNGSNVGTVELYYPVCSGR
jgi:hypothetical protein